MGVMSCSRRNCDNIMCDTYVPSVGYVCRDCQKEFKNYLNSQKDVIADSKGSITRALKDFMETTQGDFNGAVIDVNDFFREYTS